MGLGEFDSDSTDQRQNCYCRFAFSRTPGPPPFSGMNSMPAASRARSIAAITVLFTGRSASARVTVVGDNLRKTCEVAHAQADSCSGHSELRACDHRHAQKTLYLDSRYGTM